MLNPELDIDQLKKAYSVDKRLVIKDFLKADVAQRIQEYCLKHIPFNIHYVLDGQNKTISQSEMASMSDADKRALNIRIFKAAAEGSGFFYCGYRKNQRIETNSKELIFLHSVFDYFNGEEVLSLIRQISGQVDIDQADAHYTRFTPGQFLTRHRDVVSGANRRVAYVMGFTNVWHPDWGGLLQFYTEDGTPEETWTPRFNSLSIFDTSYIHAVTCVAPFAPAARFSMTGWFRASAKMPDPEQSWNVKIKI